MAARMQLAAETQPIRQAAVDNIIEQSLLSAPQSGWTIKEIRNEGGLCHAGGAPLSESDAKSGIRRLRAVNRVRMVSEGSQPKYCLGDAARREMSQQRDMTQERLSNAVADLFPDIDGALDAFLECLCSVFAVLARSYVDTIAGNASPQELARRQDLLRFATAAAAKHQLDPAAFERGIVRFFSETNPSFDAIKWNLAQNFYIARTLGIDESGLLLSRELFGNTTFFLDTNVIIQLVGPLSEHHETMRALATACSSLNIELKVLSITTAELRRTTQTYIRILEKVVDQIPDDTVQKVRGIFYKMYRSNASSANPESNLELLFADFLSPEAVLSGHGIAVVEDPWFDAASDENSTHKIADDVLRLSAERRTFPKGKAPALHDALLLRWTEEQRKHDRTSAFVVTLDRTLPLVRPKVAGRPVALTLDAVLQWMSPLAMGDKQPAFEAIFAEAVREQLLPSKQIFDLRDFLVFEEMAYSAKQLPSEEVEQCIAYLKRTLPAADPTDPSGMQHIAREMAKFFADPGSRYQSAVAGAAEARVIAESLQKEIASTAETALTERARAERAEDEREIVTKKLMEVTRQGVIERTARDLASQGWWRLVWVTLSYAVIAFAVETGVSVWGTGDNGFQRIIGAWELLAAIPLGWLIVAYVALGNRRLDAMGGPFRAVLHKFGQAPPSPPPSVDDESGRGANGGRD